MALCFSTHLSQRGEVRGPDRRKITQEQTSLNLRGGGWREGGGVKRCRKEEGGMKGERGMGENEGLKTGRTGGLKKVEMEGKSLKVS